MEKHIYWKEVKEKEFEEKVLAEYSNDEVRKHLEYLTTLIRRAGTEDESKAAKYIKGKLDEYGLDSEIYEFDAYISLPGEAALETLSPIQISLSCLPRTFIVSTPPQGIEGELISLGRGLEEDYKGVDAKGKIVLVKPADVEGRVDSARIAQEKGAIGQIHITSGISRVINMGQLRNTWGSPTPETMDKIPKIPAISICAEDGRYLGELTEKGRVLVKMKAEAWRGYKKIRVPVGILKGTREPEKFVLLAGHYCSWYVGATDNAVANSMMLEMARIFSKHRKGLARGIRFAWWSGHEQGTYAGSTWYLDNFWDDIRDNAVAYLVLDGLGRVGSSGFEPRNTEEIRRFQEGVIKEVLGLETKSRRVSRIGDQSFWGMGLPSLTGRTGFPVDPKTGAEDIWYSHTVEDTLDKVDMELIKIPFKVYSVSILRLCNNPILPFEFVTVAEEFKKRLNDLQDQGKRAIDLSSLIVQVEELEKKAIFLNKRIEKNLIDFQKKRTRRSLEKRFKEINSCFMELSRILMPILSSRAGRYGQDPMGSRFKPIPSLQELEKLNSMDNESEEYKALYTSLLRERNKVSDALNSANRILDEILSGI